MIIYNKDQLTQIKFTQPGSIYNRIKRVNSFVNNNWNVYIEALDLISQGQTKWGYSTSLEDLKFFVSTQEYILDSIQ